MVIEKHTEENVNRLESYLMDLLIKRTDHFDLKDIQQLVYENRTENMSIEACEAVAVKLYHHIFGLGVLQVFLDDSEVNEIMVNGLKNIIIEKNGKMITTDRSFESKEQLNHIIQKIVSDVNRRINAASPIVDARLADGSRVNIVLDHIALNGPTITIRKFKEQNITLLDYYNRGLISETARDTLQSFIVSRKNIFISGGTSSGKTTFLNALATCIPMNERVITIEDSAELKLTAITNLVSLETRPSNVDGTNGVSIHELIKCALRMRPDRIIVGEVRGKEALEMLHAMNTGHDGSLSTGHANSSIDMLRRLEVMVMSGMEMPLQAIKRMIGSSIDCLIHLERKPTGDRYIHSVATLDFDHDYIVKEVFTYKEGVLQ